MRLSTSNITRKMPQLLLSGILVSGIYGCGKTLTLSNGKIGKPAIESNTNIIEPETKVPTPNPSPANITNPLPENISLETYSACNPDSISIKMPKPNEKINGKFINEETNRSLQAMAEKALIDTTRCNNNIEEIEFLFRTDEQADGYAAKERIIIILDPDVDGKVSIKHLQGHLFHELGHFDERILNDKSLFRFFEAGKWNYKDLGPKHRIYGNNGDWESPAIKENDLTSTKLFSYLNQSAITDPIKDILTNSIITNQNDLNEPYTYKKAKEDILKLVPIEEKDHINSILNEEYPYCFKNPFERYAEFFELWRQDSKDFVPYVLQNWGGIKKNPYLIDELKVFIDLAFKRKKNGAKYYEIFEDGIPINIDDSELKKIFSDFSNYLNLSNYIISKPLNDISYLISFVHRTKNKHLKEKTIRMINNYNLLKNNEFFQSLKLPYENSGFSEHGLINFGASKDKMKKLEIGIRKHENKKVSFIYRGYYYRSFNPEGSHNKAVVNFLSSDEQLLATKLLNPQPRQHTKVNFKIPSDASKIVFEISGDGYKQIEISNIRME